MPHGNMETPAKLLVLFFQTHSTQLMANNRMHSDSKKRRSSFLVALLFAAGDAKR